MTVALAALVAGVAVVQAADGTVDRMPAIFAAACLDGTVALSPAEASRVGPEQMPRVLRRRLGSPLSASVWRLSGGGQSYLYVIEYKPDRNTSPKVCGVASDQMTLGSATRLLGKRLNAVANSALHQPVDGLEIINAEDGYSATAMRSGDFTYLELKQMTEQQQKRMLRRLHQIDSGIPKTPRTVPNPK